MLLESHTQLRKINLINAEGCNYKYNTRINDIESISDKASG